MTEDRRATRFTEKLSLFMAASAVLGAFFVLADPAIKIEFWGQSITVVAAFSADLKGLVIGAILIGGWNSIKEYWLGASDSGKEQQKSLARIAEQSAPVSAAAVAAATGIQPSPVAPKQADNVETPTERKEP